jgi:hypothetical protein
LSHGARGGIQWNGFLLNDTSRQYAILQQLGSSQILSQVNKYMYDLRKKMGTSVLTVSASYDLNEPHVWNYATDLETRAIRILYFDIAM